MQIEQFITITTTTTTTTTTTINCDTQQTRKRSCKREGKALHNNRHCLPI